MTRRFRTTVTAVLMSCALAAACTSEKIEYRS